MSSLIFNKDHHFFNEILTFTVALLGDLSLITLADVRSNIAEINKQGVSVSPGKTVTLKLPATLPNAFVSGKVVGAMLQNPQDVVEQLLRGTLAQIEYLERPVTMQVENKMLVPGAMWLTSVAQVCMGSAYESVSPKLKNAYGKHHLAWPPLMQYFRHLRNACFHGNCFDVRKIRLGGSSKEGIDPSNPPKWRNSIMSDVNAMNGKILFFEFLDLGDIPNLLYDIGIELESLRQSGNQ